MATPTLHTQETYFEFLESFQEYTVFIPEIYLVLRELTATRRNFDTQIFVSSLPSLATISSGKKFTVASAAPL